MSRSIFQKVYDFFKNAKTPKWIVEVLDYLLENVITPSLVMLGKEGIGYIQTLVLEASKHTDWTNRQKKDYVFNGFRENMNLPELKDRLLWLWIEQMVNKLKDQKIIK